jgi:hypothetical protein
MTTTEQLGLPVEYTWSDGSSVSVTLPMSNDDGEELVAWLELVVRSIRRRVARQQAPTERQIRRMQARP